MVYNQLNAIYSHIVRLRDTYWGGGIIIHIPLTTLLHEMDNQCVVLRSEKGYVDIITDAAYQLLETDRVC